MCDLDYLWEKNNNIKKVVLQILYKFLEFRTTCFAENDTFKKDLTATHTIAIEM